MTRWELYQQMELLMALIGSCRDAADFDRWGEDYLYAHEEYHKKKNLLRDLNRPCKRRLAL